MVPRTICSQTYRNFPKRYLLHSRQHAGLIPQLAKAGPYIRVKSGPAEDQKLHLGVRLQEGKMNTSVSSSLGSYLGDGSSTEWCDVLPET
jgi:hypothetical protein